MKKINKLLIGIMVIITLCIAIFDLKTDRIFTYILLIPTLLVPYICSKLKIKLKDTDITIYYLFLLISQVLGAICNLYNTIWWYDIFAHFISGIFTFYVGLILLNNLNMRKKSSKLFEIIFCLCFSTFIALSWEVVEFTGDQLFNLDVQHNLDTGVVDTMEDMIIAMIGAVVGSIYYSIKKKVYKYKILGNNMED